MDIDTQNSSGMMNGMPPANSNGKPTEKKIGPIIGTLIIILILIVAALYFFNQRLSIGDQNSEVSNPETSLIQKENPNTASAIEADSEAKIEEDLDKVAEDVDYSF